MKEKENWEEEKKAIEEDKASTELAREHDKIRLMEFEVLFLLNSAILPYVEDKKVLFIFIDIPNLRI